MERGMLGMTATAQIKKLSCEGFSSDGTWKWGRVVSERFCEKASSV